ncbi:uncharacterized protein LOC144199982 [Stigmatopora nigra]
MLTAAVWLMALLGLPVQGWWSLPLTADSEASQLHCNRYFYAQTFPQDQGLPLSIWCHGRPNGPNFVTLHRPGCDTAVVYAIRLSPEGLFGEDLQKQESFKIEDDVEVIVPYLCRNNFSKPPLTDDDFLHWDWSVSTIIRSHVATECNSRNGVLYILTGTGARWGEDCQMKPLWSSACCFDPHAEGGFSVGFIREDGADDGTVLPVSVKELQEKLGVQGLFAGGCAGEDRVGVKKSFYTKEDLQKMSVNLIESSSTVSDGDASHTDPNHTDPSHTDPSHTDPSPTDPSHSDSINSDGTDTDKRQTDSKEADTKEELTVETERRSVEAADETRYVKIADQEVEKADSNSSSVVVSIFYTTLSILKAPLRPIFSRITQFPGQVLYVLQEDLGVLAALPEDTVSFLYLLTSDLLSWIRWSLETLLDIVMSFIYGIYYCSSSMLAVLLNTCYMGVTGLGTLSWDTVGIFGDVLGNTWWVSKFFGGRLLRQSGDYAGTVAMEMGDQAVALGGGTGRLAWRSVVGVFNVFFTGGSVVFGVLDVIFGAFTEGFGREKEMPVLVDLVEAD